MFWGVKGEEEDWLGDAGRDKHEVIYAFPSYLPDSSLYLLSPFAIASCGFPTIGMTVSKLTSLESFLKLVTEQCESILSYSGYAQSKYTYCGPLNFWTPLVVFRGA
jgi:hypothetical protein